MVWAARGLEPWGQQKGSLKAGQQQGSQEEGQHLGLYRRWRALGSAPGFRAVINKKLSQTGTTNTSCSLLGLLNSFAFIFIR